MKAKEDLQKRLASLTEKLTTAESLATKISLANADLKEDLAERDRRIEQLKAAPAIQESADKKALIAAVMKKDEELAGIKAQLAALAQTHEKTAADSLAASAQELQDVKQKLNEQSATIRTLTDAKGEVSTQVKTLTDANNVLTAKAQGLTEANTDLNARILTLTDTNNKLSAELAQAGTRATAPQANVRQLTLDLNEKEALITTLKREIDSTSKALKAAEAMAKETAERTAVQLIRQEGTDKIINERDMKISLMEARIDALKKELSAAQTSQNETLTKSDESEAAKKIAEDQLRSRDSEISVLQEKARDLSADIKAAKELLDKKDRDHNATLKELRRLNDLLANETEKLRKLEERAKGKTLPAPSLAAPEAAKDCTTNCVK
jgi:chromosome segregation ATPase